MNIDNRRDTPERREMDMIGNVFKRHWLKILVFVFALGGIWANLQAQLSAHSAFIAEFKTTVKALMEADNTARDFMIAQNEINKKIDKIDSKLDRLLRR